VKYQPPFLESFGSVPVNGIYNTDPNASYVNGNPATGEPGSIPPFEAVEHVMRELVHLIVWSGQTPSHTDLEQVRKALKGYVEAAVVSNAGGTPIYEGMTSEDKPRHKIRPLIAGSNITFDLVENPVGSGRYGLRINAASAGGGGGSVPLENVGTGAQVYKGFDGTNDELRSIKGINGITVTQDTNEIVVNGAAISAATLNGLAPMMIARETRAGNAAAWALTRNAYNRRRINTLDSNGIASATLSGEQITLPAGTYRVRGAAACFDSGHMHTALWNVTDGALIAQGIGIDSHGTANSCGISELTTRFTIAATKVIELRSYEASASSATPKSGDDQSLPSTMTHTDAWIEITKEQ
jgi:hypothetical protein